MKWIVHNILFTIVCLTFANSIHAQGGGPPMLTDDPGTVDAHKWEINTSINLEITKEVQLSVPYIDANYGAAKGFQLKIEMPYTITIDQQKQTSGAFGDPLIGIKYNLMDESRKFLSASIYPQATVTGNQKGFLFPLLLAKTFGRFVIGEELGYSSFENNNNSLLNGNLLSYKASGKLELMAEYFMQKDYSPTAGTQGFINCGCRYGINKTFTLLASLGTQIITPADAQRQYFFSFVGIQSSF